MQAFLRLLPAILALCLPPVAASAMEQFVFERLSGQKLQQAAPVALESFYDGTTILTFWRADCPPCRIELAHLPAIATAHPGMRIVLLSLMGAEPIREHMPDRWPDNLHVVAVQGSPKEVMHAFGNRQGDGRYILPYSLALRPGGARCREHYGILSHHVAQEWERACR